MSKRYRLNTEDLYKILIGACIAMGGAFLTYLSAVVYEIDFGVWTPMVTALLAIFINAARKFLEERE